VADKKSFLLRVSPDLYDAVAAWAGEELRSMNGQIEFLLRRALADAGRLGKRPTTDGEAPRARLKPPAG
jgi:hypothetical protein